MALLLGDVPGAEQVELDSPGDVCDAGLAGLAGRVVAGLLGAVVSDIYNEVKKWTGQRAKESEKKADAVADDQQIIRQRTLVIYGPDGKIERYYRIDEYGKRQELQD